MLALVLAFPLEFALTGQFSYPFDMGFDPSDLWVTRVLSYVWLVTHWPALVALPWLEARHGSPQTEMFVLFSTGYLDLAILLFVGIMVVRWIYHHLPLKAQPS